jgi:tetratricopeptide (TPR) repeat protein
LSTLYEGLAAIEMSLQHADRAREYLQKCLHHARRAGSLRKELVARWWWMLMTELNPGHHDAAVTEIEALLQLCGEAAPPSFRAVLVANLGQIAADREDHRRARIHFDEALAMAERLDPAHQAVLWLLSGTAACAAADWPTARRDLGRLVADAELGTRPGNRVALPFLALAGDADARQRLGTWEPHSDAARAIWELVRGRVTPLGEALAQTNWGARVAYRCQARGDSVAPDR